MLRLREEGRDAIESAKCQRCLLGEILQVLIHDNGRDGRQGSGNKCTAGLPQGRNGKIVASESSFHGGMCNFRRLKLHIPACYAISIIHRLTVFPHAASARLPHIVCGRRLRGCRCAGIEPQPLRLCAAELSFFDQNLLAADCQRGLAVSPEGKTRACPSPRRS